MGRSKTQAKRRGGRKAVSEKGTAKGMPAGVSQFGGTEKHGPVGGPKGPTDPGPRKLTWNG